MLRVDDTAHVRVVAIVALPFFGEKIRALGL